MFPTRDPDGVTGADENTRRPGKGGITDFDSGSKSGLGLTQKIFGGENVFSLAVFFGSVCCKGVSSAVTRG